MTPAFGIFLVVLLITANALFVAAEFALVGSRRANIEELAATGDRRAERALHELKNLSFVLSAAQFGITATSLLVGLLAEDAIGGALEPLVGSAVAIGGAFFLSTVLQMVFGELAPKNLALARPEPVAMRLSGFMRAFGIVFGPIIRVFDGLALLLTRSLGIEVTEELETAATGDELALIIEASSEGGSLTNEQADLLRRGIELGDRRVQEILRPRPDVVWLRATDTLEDLRTAARDSGHSRFPVRGADDDDVLGTVHVKDLLDHEPSSRSSIQLGDVAQDVLVAPESESLRDLLRQFRNAQRTFAIVVDEYGAIAGIVTIEDVVEELVGDINDEFDRVEVASVRRIGDGRFLVIGSLRADRLGPETGIVLPDGDYDTVAGFLLEQFGRIPEVGETVTHADWAFEVTRVDGVRIAEVEVRRLPAQELATTEQGMS